jgi:uncharacterized protein (TIGR02284 family)
MENVNQQIIRTLNHLIAIAEDGCQGYKNAAYYIKDSGLTGIFGKYAHQRSFYIVQLQQELAKLESTPQEYHNGDVLGFFHRMWMELKSIITSGDKEAIINACLTGEAAAVKSYKKALQNNFFNDYTRSILEEQLLGIEKIITELNLKLTAV